MTTRTSDENPEPDDVNAIWALSEEIADLRAALAEAEGQLLMRVCVLEQTHMSPIQLLKICREPLIVARALQLGRFEHKRPFIDVYDKVVQLAQEMNHAGE